MHLTTVSIAKNSEYLIDADELTLLRDNKIINAATYVYFALKISFTAFDPTIDISSFCARWDLELDEFHSAIAALYKKEILKPQTRQLSLQLFPLRTAEQIKADKDAERP